MADINFSTQAEDFLNMLGTPKQQEEPEDPLSSDKEEAEEEQVLPDEEETTEAEGDADETEEVEEEQEFQEDERLTAALDVINELKEEVAALKAAKEQGQQKHTEDAPTPVKFVRDDQELEELMSSADRFNGAFNNLLGQVREIMMSSMPMIANVAIDDRMSQQTAAQQFVSTNHDLFEDNIGKGMDPNKVKIARYQALIEKVKEVQAKNPGLARNYIKLYEKAGEEIRNAIGLPKKTTSKSAQTKTTSTTKEKQRLPFAKAGGGGGVARENKKVAKAPTQQTYMDDLIKHAWGS